MRADIASGLVDFKLHLGADPRHDPAHPIKIAVRDLDFWYGDAHALKSVSLDIHEREVTALIGPSGCGKSTLLRCLNRSNDRELIPVARQTGTIRLDGLDVHDPAIDPPLFRRRFGWVAQRPNPFPWSVRANVAYGPGLQGLTSDRRSRDDLVEMCLRRVGLWEEVKDRLDETGTDLSGGQQQRLCIARAIAFRPEVLLMDEPASSLDPISTARIEDLIGELRREFTIVMITHNMQQAARIAQRVAVLHLGRLVEVGDAVDIFRRPTHEVTRAYMAGWFG